MPELRLATAALLSSPLIRPIQKPLHLIPILPGQTKEFPRRHFRRLRPKEGLKSPAQVRAIPGMEPVALRGNPVVPQHLEHVLWESPFVSSCETILNLP